MKFATASLIRLRGARPEVESGHVEATVNESRSLLAREERQEREVAATTVVPSRKTLLIGLDLGARHTRMAAVVPGVEQFYLRRTIPTAVAYHALPDEKTISPFLYFGEEAVARSGRFRLVQPWQAGDLADPVLAREFVRYLRELMRRSDLPRARVVVGVPLAMSAEGRHHLTQAMHGLLEQVVFLPRPYLSALGLQDQLGTEAIAKFTGHTVLLADLGAGSTEVIRIGTTYPQPDEMKAAAFGGDDVELLVQEGLRKQYPALRPTRDMIRGWLENFGFVGRAVSPVIVKLPVDGIEQSVNVTHALSRSGEVWAMHVQQLLLNLLPTTSGSSRPVQVFLCGGGSRIENLETVLSEMLSHAGHPNVSFTVVEEKEMSLSARGALRAARKIRDDQWARFELV